MKGLVIFFLAGTLLGITLAVSQPPGGTGASSPTGSQDPAPPAADSPTDATVKLEGGSVAAGIGYVWGEGTVTYHGVDHKFKLKGISVVDVGGAKIYADGFVTHLSTLNDFAGTYTAWDAGITLAAGGSAVYMKNEHGVVIKLISKTQGLRFNLSGNGVRVQLQR